MTRHIKSIENQGFMKVFDSDKKKTNKRVQNHFSIVILIKHALFGCKYDYPISCNVLISFRIRKISYSEKHLSNIHVYWIKGLYFLSLKRLKVSFQVDWHKESQMRHKTEYVSKLLLNSVVKKDSICSIAFSKTLSLT